MRKDTENQAKRVAIQHKQLSEILRVHAPDRIALNFAELLEDETHTLVRMLREDVKE